jgi:hypothetical protein
MKKILLIMAISALAGCNTKNTQQKSQITNDDLALSYKLVLFCVESKYWDTSKSKSVELRVKESLDLCDEDVTSYSNMLSDKALQDNGWGRYTQPIPYETKISVYSDTLAIMSEHYSNRDRQE